LDVGSPWGRGRDARHFPIAIRAFYDVADGISVGKQLFSQGLAQDDLEGMTEGRLRVALKQIEAEQVEEAGLGIQASERCHAAILAGQLTA